MKLHITPGGCSYYRGEDIMPARNAEHLVDGVNYTDLEVTAQQAEETADAFIAELGLDYMVRDCTFEAARVQLPEENTGEPVEKMYNLQYGPARLTACRLRIRRWKTMRRKGIMRRRHMVYRGRTSASFLIDDDGIRDVRVDITVYGTGDRHGRYAD